MANNQLLKDAIAAVIKTNGNNEITGEIMQSALLAIINQFGLGGVFAGTATPATVPVNSDVVAFYVANTNGVYANFGGYELKNNDFVIFSNKSGVYEAVSIIAIAAKVPTWQAASYNANAQVVSIGRIWVSNAATVSTDIPGTSPKWSDLGYGYNDAINQKVSVKNPTQAARIFDNTDTFNFTDGLGNVMFSIAVEGSKSLNYNIIDPVTKTILATLNKTWIENFNAKIATLSRLGDIRPAYRTDGYYFTDQFGNLMAKLTADGFQSFKFINKLGEEVGTKPPKKLDGKFVFSLGDSHATAKWLDEFCIQTGAGYDLTIQNAVKANEGNYTDSALMLNTAKALKQYSVDNAKSVDVILIENCHFGVSGVISDYVPMNYENLKIHPTTYASYAAFLAAIGAERPAFVATLTPTLKTALRFRYNTFKETITFSSAGALTAGNATLTIDGNNFAISVAAGETLVSAVTRLNDWGFDDYLPNWSNLTTKGQQRPLATIDLTYKGTNNPPAEPVISFNAGTTGMVMASKALNNTTSYQDYYYNSFALAEWNTMSKWVGTNGTTVYPSMMGLIEFLQVNFPTTEIIVWAVQSLNVSTNKNNANSFLVETFAGSGQYYLNMAAYMAAADTIKYRASQVAMREVTLRYSCRFLDVDLSCGISPINMFTGGYFNSNDLHPKEAGYRQWGKTLAKLY
jgi:hypothetical protein